MVRPVTPSQSSRLSPSRRSRATSWVLDYLVVLAWLGVVLVVLGLPTLAGWVDLSAVWSRWWAADIAVTVLTVLPYLAYLVGAEAGPRRATWGKRRTGLAVAPLAATGPDDGTGRRGLRLRRVVVRNVVKVLPWQLGHMSAMRFATSTGDVVPPAALVMYAGSTLLLLAVAVPPVLGRRGLHDVLAATEVVPRRPRPRPATPRLPASP